MCSYHLYISGDLQTGIEYSFCGVSSASHWPVVHVTFEVQNFWPLPTLFVAEGLKPFPNLNQTSLPPLVIADLRLAYSTAHVPYGQGEISNMENAMRKLS
jgi:hypothetical protein